MTVENFVRIVWRVFEKMANLLEREATAKNDQKLQNSNYIVKKGILNFFNFR